MSDSSLDAIIAYMKLAHPNDWRDYVFFRESSDEPVAVMFPAAGTFYHEPDHAVYRLVKTSTERK